ncbi:dicarboxylate/amino acid:cation symporter [Brevibacillus daliensis]|uniref:dicarboxylate/amino acid:cation symporter n=1 Tax=Brevibacillus daliensis TaxID=2892995 RepID=UPI001E469FBC|nr:dicarboxylate/amino acid:cation symporter [Brevibacillus daliensis]
MKKMGLLPKIIIAIILGVVIGSISPEPVVKVLATFSGIFGNFLGFIIPLIIIGFIAPGIGELGKGAGKLLGITTAFSYGSTIIAGGIAYAVGSYLFPKMLTVGQLSSFVNNPEEALTQPYFVIDMPPIMGVMTALLFAFTIGLGSAAIKGASLQKVMIDVRDIVEKCISAIIIPLLPIHIMSVFSNLTYGGQVQTIISVFFKVFMVIIALHIIYILMQYALASTVSKTSFLSMLKNMLPVYMTAIGTQSSAATIPVTLRQVKENKVSNQIADFVVPLCATIHLSGSTITLVSCSMAVMMLNGMSTSVAVMLPFILMLGITMVAAPGVPGGAVMAAIGLLETMLGFTPTLTSLMIALYLAQDSFGTACNVTGDGAIAVLTDRFSGGNKKEHMETSKQSILEV